MYGRFPKPKKPGQGRLRTIEPLELAPQNEEMEMRLQDYSRIGARRTEI
jgi:hypothetical protein